MSFFDFFKKKTEINEDTQTAEYLFSKEENKTPTIDCSTCIFKDKCLNKRKDDIDLCR